MVVRRLKSAVRIGIAEFLMDFQATFSMFLDIEKVANRETFVGCAGDGDISERDKYTSSVIPDLPSVAYCKNRLRI